MWPYLRPKLDGVEGGDELQDEMLVEDMAKNEYSVKYGARMTEN